MNKKDSNAKKRRRIYCNHYQVEDDRSFDIHHIDFNHENDDISNLVMIPRELHRKYHEIINELGGIHKGGVVHVDAMLHTGVSNSHCELIVELGETIRELNKYMLSKAVKDAQMSTFNNGEER